LSEDEETVSVAVLGTEDDDEPEESDAEETLGDAEGLVDVVVDVEEEE
jgi:hypothetical protein